MTSLGSHSEDVRKGEGSWKGEGLRNHRPKPHWADTVWVYWILAIYMGVDCLLIVGEGSWRDKG